MLTWLIEEEEAFLVLLAVAGRYLFTTLFTKLLTSEVDWVALFPVVELPPVPPVPPPPDEDEPNPKKFTMVSVKDSVGSVEVPAPDRMLSTSLDTSASIVMESNSPSSITWLINDVASW